MEAKKQLWYLMGLGFALRTAFIFLSDHIYYPDELFQTLEQGYRLAFGYGLIPWDIELGLRSWILPPMIAVLLKFFALLGCNYPSCYGFGIKLWGTLASLTLVWSVYWLSWYAFHNRRIAFLTAVVVAGWYELIYFAARPLSEVMATYLVVGALALLVRKQWLLFAGFLLGMGGMLRLQYGVSLGLTGLIWFMMQSHAPLGKKTLQRFWSSHALVVYGVLMAIGLYGFTDWLAMGVWFGSSIQNLRLSYFGGLSQVFGTAPWYSYFLYLSITSGGVYWVAVMDRRRNGLWVLVLVTLGVHSLFGHKEYRFLFLLMPLLWIFTIPSLDGVLKKWVTSKSIRTWLIVMILGFISGLGLFNRLPGQAMIYPQPLLSHYLPLKGYFWLGQQPSVCGVWDKTGPWMLTGGYYYLGKAVPLYSQDYVPSSEKFVSHIQTWEELGPPWQLVKFLGGLKIYSREGDCEIDPAYTHYRSLPQIEKRLRRS